MIVGSGIDLMAVNEIQRELAHRAWTVADGIFRQSELNHCNAARSPARMLAAYFAVKEAAAKALAIRFADLAIFREIEVTADGPGHVQLRFHGRAQKLCDALGVKRVLAALHSDRYMAAAMVLLEG